MSLLKFLSFCCHLNPPISDFYYSAENLLMSFSIFMLLNPKVILFHLLKMIDAFIWQREGETELSSAGSLPWLSRPASQFLVLSSLLAHPVTLPHCRPWMSQTVFLSWSFALSSAWKAIFLVTDMAPSSFHCKTLSQWDLTSSPYLKLQSYLYFFNWLIFFLLTIIVFLIYILPLPSYLF